MSESRPAGELARRVEIIALVAAVLLAAGGIALYAVYQERDSINELGWTYADTTVEPGEKVTVTWLGVTTLLFDDGETQILIDGFFTRFDLLGYLLGDIESDIANVNYAMSEYRMNRLAAIIPVHSHFDHAMDIGVVANRSTAVVLGSESTANIARGARVPVQQYQILADGEERQFGNFTIRVLVSRHAPLSSSGEGHFPGSITEPLRQPADVDDWKQGVAYSVILQHPRGTALVQGSAGYVDGKLEGIEADAVMLGIGGLASLGEDYAETYWQQTVELSGAKRVYPVHYDDFNLAFGRVELFPVVVDDSVTAAQWLSSLAENADPPVEINLLPFGERVVIF